jgi:hypothetical protein
MPRLENTNRGKNPNTHAKHNWKRQPMLMLVCGETGIGKTRRTLLEGFEYLNDNPETGKAGLKIIAFDVNGDDFPMFKSVRLDSIHLLKRVQARRVLPINSDGTPMTIEDKRAVVEQIIKQFKNGLIMLEDPDKYMNGAKGQSVVGLLTTNRHRGLDIMLSHQSVAKISTTEWQNCTWLRLHHQVDDISRYRNRIPNYFIVRIASFIVNEQYSQATIALRRGEIGEEDYKYYRSFFVYVDMRKLLIRGCTKGAFIRACKKYIDTEESRAVKNMLQERDAKDRKIYKNRHDAVLHLIVQYARHYDITGASPMIEHSQQAA